MKTFCRIVWWAVCLMALLSFLPWLYDIAFPGNDREPFVAWSPVCDAFVVSENGETKNIYTVDAQGNPVLTGLTSAERDSLVPQMYFNQLQARRRLPDTIAGHAIDVATLKQAQWVFNSLPRDINKTDPGVYPIMESRPKRVDLEDPVEVFTLDGGAIRFIDMATNTENADRSARFARVFADKGFSYPALTANANITAKKAYDEGYMLIDADHKLYHMKMQAGMPYLAPIAMPDGAVPVNAFILENPDVRHIALVVTADGSLYAVERDGYRPVRLPVDGVNAASQRITIMKNLFNWVIRVTSAESTRWVAIDSDDYSPLGTYAVESHESEAKRVSRWIFPLRLSFTSLDSCLAYPRITDFSLPATLLWLAAIAIFLIIKNRKKQ